MLVHFAGPPGMVCLLPLLFLIVQGKELFIIRVEVGFAVVIFLSFSFGKSLFSFSNLLGQKCYLFCIWFGLCRIFRSRKLVALDLIDNCAESLAITCDGFSIFTDLCDDLGVLLDDIEDVPGAPGSVHVRDIFVQSAY